TTIAHSVDVAPGAGRSALDLLLEHLSDRQLLLVLDNFEHVLGAAPVLAQLLETCPRLVLLVTSRTVLRLRSEQRFVVGPLPAPPAEGSHSVEATTASAAARLFAERARAVDPDFSVDEHNAPSVGAICRRLDGMPLAIELVAARTELLGPEALLRRLERALPL